MSDKREDTGASEFPVETVLRDGARILIRPIQANDKHFLEMGLQQLSAQDRYFRFFQPMPKLSDKLLKKFTEVDHINQEAIGAMDISVTPGVPIGVARYSRIPETGPTAEVAVTVTSSYQGRGLGTLLLGFVAHRAVENGIFELSALVMSDNLRMLEILEELDAKMEFLRKGEVDIRIPLHRDCTNYPKTPAGDVFRQVNQILTSRR